MLTAHGVRQIPRTSPVDLSQTLPLRRVVLRKDTEPAQAVPLASRSKIREELNIVAGLLVILTIETGFFFYLWGFRVLLLFCLGVFLLSLGVLLHALFSWRRAS